MNFQHLKYFLGGRGAEHHPRSGAAVHIPAVSLQPHQQPGAGAGREAVHPFPQAVSHLCRRAAGGDSHPDSGPAQPVSQQGGGHQPALPGVLRVGTSHTCGLAVLPEILPRFRAEFPMVEFSLFEGNSIQLEDELSHGRVDLMICWQPIRMDGVESIPLTQQRLVMVVPRAFTDQIFGIGPRRPGKPLQAGRTSAPFDSSPLC